MAVETREREGGSKGESKRGVIRYKNTLLPEIKFWHILPLWSILFSVMLHQTEKAIYSPVLQKW